MEIFGIVFSFPGAFIASVVYRFVVLRSRSRWPWMTPLALFTSCLTICGIVTEWILLAIHGAVGTRNLVGPAFYPLHSLCFVFGTPALVNVLVLWRPSMPLARWHWVATLSAIFALILVIQQYAVFEALYGIDGNGGPFVGL